MTTTNNKSKGAAAATALARLARLPLLLAACFAVANTAQAAPATPQVVTGQATFTQQGNVFTITNTPNTIINWQTFSIGAGEITRFLQQSGDSAVLNRIVGQDPSRILGALQSNGQVFLINPNGILFGRDARIDVNGLTASTLNLSNADFLAGRRRFGGGPGANPGAHPNSGAIDNQGAISTPAGGKVYLIAPSVTNSGIISSPQGEVVLAAGHSVQLVDSANPDLHVVVSAPASEAVNLGRIIAEGGKIGIYGALVRQRGTVSADSARRDASGKIVFKASGDAVLEAGSLTSASGAGRGGAISVQGERVGMTGDARIDASGAAGGGSVLLGGGYQGRNPLLRNSRQTLMGSGASIRADGGTVVLWSDGATRAYGRIAAKGGLVETSGAYLDVNGMKVDAATWLLDPFDVIIGKNGSTVTLASVDQFDEGASTGPTYVDTGMFSTAAPGANIVIQAKNDITVESAITRQTGTTGALTMDAGNDIIVNASIATQGGALTLNANQAPYSSGRGSVNVNAPIATGGGKFSANGDSIQILAPVNNYAIDTGTGDIELRASQLLRLGINTNLNSAGMIALTADQIDLPGHIGPSQGTRPQVNINAFTLDRTIDITDNPVNSGALSLLPTQLNPIFARQLTIGNASMQAPITVNGALGGPNRPFESPGLSLETHAGITVNAPISLLPDTSSNLALTSHGSTSGVITTTTPGALTADTIFLTADNMSLNAAITGSGTGGGQIWLSPRAASNEIALGAGAFDQTARLGLDSIELGRVKARRINIGNRTQSTGSVVVIGALNMAHLATDSKLELNAQEGNVRFDAPISTPGALVLKGAALTNGANAPVAAGAISLNSTVGIGNGNTSPFVTQTAFLNADNQSPSGTGGIHVSNTGVLNLGNVTQSGSGNTGAIDIVNQGGMTVLKNEPGVQTPVTVSTGGGAISLRAMSPLTILGNVASNGGAIDLTAGNGGVLTVASGASVASGAGNMQLTGGSIVQNGALSSTSGNITLSGNPVSGSGTISTVSGAVSGAPAPTIDQCRANPQLPGCSAVLPALSTCIANPSTPGCDVVLPSVDQCSAAPATPGCEVVMPSLAQCTAAPATPGCSAVLPSLAQCTAAPATAGCSAVLPTLAQCTAAPATPGCSVVLPTLAQCTAAPATPGCSAVLPTLAQCTAAPATVGCSAVLPTLSQCTATPATPGCAAVLPTLSQCVANPATAGCSAVLPGLAVCTAAPATPGCSVVLPSLAACIATPSMAGCSVVLPSLATCSAAPATPGCSVVLPSVAQCVANRSLPGCNAVLPSLSQCIAAPATAGCSVVLPSLAQCIAVPTTSGCGVVLPSLNSCVANPGAPGCGVVLPSLAACTVNPSLGGCSVVLPTLNQCIASPALAGCTAVLPVLSQCVANPGLAGCAVVLPTLSLCVSAPATAGCSVVLPTLAQCTGSPTLQGCSVVLPPVSACVANPAAPGCTVVVPPAPAPTPAGSPLLTQQNATVDLINNAVGTPASAPAGSKLPGADAAPEKADEKRDESRKLAGLSPLEGEKSDVRKKTYCN